jgi:two-component system, NtrC family, response regulator AtoC
METTAILAGLGETPSTASTGDYLVCIEGERSWTVLIPASGELIIGRDPQLGLVLGDSLVSRAHAQILSVPEGLRLMDLGSRHGTTVNGERIVAPRMLRSGDVLGLGESVIVVRQTTRTAHANQVSGVSSFLRRIGEETDRALRYQRELAVVVMRMTARKDAVALVAALVPRLRAIDVIAALGDGAVAILMPEFGDDEVTAALDGAWSGIATLGWSREQLAIGIAVSPFDGVDADTLLGAARSAATLAEGGQRRSARDAVAEMVVSCHRILVADPAMARLYDLTRRLARSTLAVLVLGETGAGKELAAAAVHGFSQRASGPFISVNCAAIPENLAESELFGHTRGAFSGAVAAKVGQLEAAHGGTLFLDEIGELPLSIQAKLLRALESGEIQRVGEISPRTVDIRIVAATNRDLESEVAAGRFRSDLFFRLGAARLILPPLRDRPRDLACLAIRFLDELCRAQERAPLAWSVAAAQALFAHEWPGNIRELRNAVQYAVSAAPDDAVEVETWHLPPPIAHRPRKESASDLTAQPAPHPVLAAGAGFRPIADDVRELERRRMVEALRATGGVQNRAAELIEMPLRTFATKLKRYRIASSDWGG